MTSDEIQDAADEAEEAVEKAMIAAVAALATTIAIADLAAALSTGDSESVTNALGIDGDEWAAFDEQLGQHVRPPLANLYESAGQITARDIGNGATSPLTTRFLVNGQPIIQESTQAQRRIARSLSSRRLGENEAYNRARLIRRTIGLSENQAATVKAFRDQIDGNAQPNTKNLLNRATLAHLNAAERNELRKHARDRHLDQNRKDELTQRLSDRLLTTRAATIARTETQRTANQAEHDAWKKAVEEGTVKGNVRRFWVHMADERVRFTHRQIPGMNKDGVGLDEKFDTPHGPHLYPPAGPNCRCRVLTIARDN